MCTCLLQILLKYYKNFIIRYTFLRQIDLYINLSNPIKFEIFKGTKSFLTIKTIYSFLRGDKYP